MKKYVMNMENMVTIVGLVRNTVDSYL